MLYSNKVLIFRLYLFSMNLRMAAMEMPLRWCNDESASAVISAAVGRVFFDFGFDFAVAFGFAIAFAFAFAFGFGFAFGFAFAAPFAASIHINDKRTTQKNHCNALQCLE